MNTKSTRPVHHSKASSNFAQQCSFSNNIQQQAVISVHQRVVLLMISRRLRGDRSSWPPEGQPCQSVLGHSIQRYPPLFHHFSLEANFQMITCCSSTLYFTSSKRGQLSLGSCRCTFSVYDGTTCLSNLHLLELMDRLDGDPVLSKIPSVTYKIPEFFESVTDSVSIWMDSRQNGRARVSRTLERI